MERQGTVALHACVFFRFGSWTGLTMAAELSKHVASCSMLIKHTFAKWEMEFFC